MRKMTPGSLNWPNWLRDKMIVQHAVRGEDLMRALLESAPLDLRVNAAEGERDPAVEALKSVGFPAAPTPYSPWGIRVARDADLVGANIRALPMFRDGKIEIQDEGSQLTALLSGARPGEQILELCAGGGGKTLALAAMTGRKGQIYACDIDAARLKTGQERIKRARLHTVQPRHIRAWDPKSGGADPDLESFAGKIDLVFLDVPCTGSGAWRRAPDAKWRLTPETFARLRETQAAILRRGARLAKPGGRMVYVTCSLFAEENADQVSAFLDSQHRTLLSPPALRGRVREGGDAPANTPHPADVASDLGHPLPQGEREFQLSDMATLWREGLGGEPPDGTLIDIPGASGAGLQLSPVTTHTDGFFIAVLQRAK